MPNIYIKQTFCTKSYTWLCDQVCILKVGVKKAHLILGVIVEAGPGPVGQLFPAGIGCADVAGQVIRDVQWQDSDMPGRAAEPGDSQVVGQQQGGTRPGPGGGDPRLVRTGCAWHVP